jgi:hypothetical protein
VAPLSRRGRFSFGRAYSPPIATHRYETRLRWNGSTGLGWDHYDRGGVTRTTPRR